MNKRLINIPALVRLVLLSSFFLLVAADPGPSQSSTHQTVTQADAPAIQRHDAPAWRALLLLAPLPDSSALVPFWEPVVRIGEQGKSPHPKDQADRLVVSGLSPPACLS